MAGRPVLASQLDRILFSSFFSPQQTPFPDIPNFFNHHPMSFLDSEPVPGLYFFTRRNSEIGRGNVTVQNMIRGQWLELRRSTIVLNDGSEIFCKRLLAYLEPSSQNKGPERFLLQEYSLSDSLLNKKNKQGSSVLDYSLRQRVICCLCKMKVVLPSWGQPLRFVPIQVRPRELRLQSSSCSRGKQQIQTPSSEHLHKPQVMDYTPYQSTEEVLKNMGRWFDSSYNRSQALLPSGSSGLVSAPPRPLSSFSQSPVSIDSDLINQALIWEASLQGSQNQSLVPFGSSSSASSHCLKRIGHGTLPSATSSFIQREQLAQNPSQKRALPYTDATQSHQGTENKLPRSEHGGIQASKLLASDFTWQQVLESTGTSASASMSPWDIVGNFELPLSLPSFRDEQQHTLTTASEGFGKAPYSGYKSYASELVDRVLKSGAASEASQKQSLVAPGCSNSASSHSLNTIDHSEISSPTISVIDFVDQVLNWEASGFSSAQNTIGQSAISSQSPSFSQKHHAQTLSQQDHIDHSSTKTRPGPSACNIQQTEACNSTTTPRYISWQEKEPIIMMPTPGFCKPMTGSATESHNQSTEQLAEMPYPEAPQTLQMPSMQAQQMGQMPSIGSSGSYIVNLQSQRESQYVAHNVDPTTTNVWPPDQSLGGTEARNSSQPSPQNDRTEQS